MVLERHLLLVLPEEAQLLKLARNVVGTSQLLPIIAELESLCSFAYGAYVADRHVCRLKLRCNKLTPCATCSKRGLPERCSGATIGESPTDPTTLMLAAATSTIRELQDRNKALEEHIVTLQQAVLDVLHGDKSVMQPEHVLHAELIELKKKNQVAACIDKTDMLTQVVDSFGTLSVSVDTDKTTFLGSTASSEFFINLSQPEQNQDFAGHRLKCSTQNLPAELLLLGRIFSFSSSPELASANIRLALRAAAPPANIARVFCENFFTYGSWLSSPICRKEFFEEVFEPLYAASSWSDFTFDRIALLYAMLSVGMLLDFRLEKATDRWNYGYRFHKIAGGTLGMAEYQESPSVTGCQVLALVCLFHLYADDPDGPARCFATTGLLLRLGQSLGLHRKNPIFESNVKERRRRSRIWWEIVFLDRMQSLFYGRPSAIDNKQCDAPFPEQCSDELTHRVVKHQFIDSCIVPVLTQVLAVEPPNYATVLKLDKLVRDFQMPDPIPPITDGEQSAMCLAFQNYALHGYREMTLLHLHRSAFIAALRESPHDPLKHRFSPSVLAVHKSACVVIHNTYALLQQYSVMVPRSYIWALHAFSASVLLAALVTRCPGSSLSNVAMIKLGYACSIFEQCKDNVRMSTALPIVLKFHNVAQKAFVSFKAGEDTQPTDQEKEQLSILSGTTQVVFSQARSQGSSPGDSDSLATPDLGEALEEHFRSVEREQQQFDPTNPVAPVFEPAPSPIPIAPEISGVEGEEEAFLEAAMQYFKGAEGGGAEVLAGFQGIPGQLPMPIDGVNYNLNMLQESQSNDPLEFLSRQVINPTTPGQSWDYAP
ncbi:SubName: Full=Uncharacterized protein {ECO:0000313/EMBL:CCA77995.1} [Serendipita indica DSM 11827]|nr:SubName: Full=Uncharacterized protein {ECO:0000313/EMBL:CCA77995.1} [Serendipita indica DSM 11827]